MFKDLTFFRQNYGKNHTTVGNNENLPVDPTISCSSQLEADPSRTPFHAIQETAQNPNQEMVFRRKNEKTPFKGNARGPDSFSQLSTPEKSATVQKKFGCIPKGEQPGLACPASGEEQPHQGQFQMLPPPPPQHPFSFGNCGGYFAATPRTITTGGRASSVHSGTSSTQSTPTKSVTKPMVNGASSSRVTQCGGMARAMNFLTSSKGMLMSSASLQVYAPSEVPHFELKENPSFWIDHNVQVLVRIRPINCMERSLHGNSRCIKQENAHSITWIGQPENRFIFDFIACETINQEILFRVAGLPMVENCMSGYNSCVFAYGQTGSGKTHTMLGEIDDLDTKASPDRGLTPRIFEFLFARIKAEEESRRDEKLQYSCKCSFLEIYNEQITDLLSPSSTNLLIREDLRKGVYVENLKEFEVETVGDILKLLMHGAANRKVAATNMNRESSRSHSVFTCTIESRWKKDETSTLRFARLNLVDLAGSERQKASGAEGERLKEASNINKSLSTLGHVIMVLADLANGRQRHVPYRDSRLTFLLQDSLGGNSKTMIIANVSPSICSANETLSTLKFAQRAKIIQNNAVINEDASGDILALQHQVHLLKEKLSMLKRQNISRSLSFPAVTLVNAEFDAYSPPKLPPNLNQMHDNEESSSFRALSKKLKSFEAILAGALRREIMADTSVKQLEAEIEQLNRLVRQREEDAQCSKMMLKFREDKIYRMESLLNGMIPSESYLADENNALSEEIKLLQSKIDKNPEVTRFALENIRLLDKLRKFQDFYEEGERELLTTELSEMRNQLARILDGKSKQEHHSKSDLNVQDYFLSLPKHAEEILNLELELDILKAIVGEERSYRLEAEQRGTHAKTELNIAKEELMQINARCDGTVEELKDARSVIEALESQQIIFINDLEELRENNSQFEDVLKKQEEEISTLRKQLALYNDGENRRAITAHESLKKGSENDSSPLKEKLIKVQASHEKAWNLNMRYQNDQAYHTSNEKEMDEIRGQVEAETAEVILCLQDELATLSQLVDENSKTELLAKQSLTNLEKERKEQEDKIFWLTQENTRLSELVQEKEQNVMSIMAEWEQLALDIANVLESGTIQLDNASNEVASISETLSHKSWMCEQFGKIIKSISKRDSLIVELQKNLEDAYNARHDMEWKLRSLRGATLAITEAQQQQSCDNESRIMHLTSQLDEKMSIISELEDRVEHSEKKVLTAEVCAIMFFFTARRLYDIKKAYQAIDEANVKLGETEKFFLQKDIMMQDQTCLLANEDKGGQTLRALEQKYQKEKSIEQQQTLSLACHCKTKNRRKTRQGTCGLVEAELKLQEFQMQISMLRSCMHEYVEKESNLKEPHSPGNLNVDNDKFDYEYQNTQDSGRLLKLIEALSRLKERAIIGCQHSPVDEIKFAESVDHLIENKQITEDILEREKTLEILRKEITSALRSLKEVQSQMAKMFDNKEEIKKSMLFSQDSNKDLQAEVGNLSSEILIKEKDFNFKLLQLEKKLLTVEGSVTEFEYLWRKELEELEYEMKELRDAAVKKNIETSNLLNKIEEAQETMGEADFMVNVLMEANDKAKHEIDRLKKAEIALYHENSCLLSKLNVLQASLDEKDEKLDCFQKNLHTKHMEAMTLVLAVEDQFMNLKDDFVESNWIERIEADVMVNDALLEAKKINKVEIDRLKKTENSLYHENCCLLSKLCDLQASLDEKDESLDYLQKIFRSNLMELKDLVFAVNEQYSSIKDVFVEMFSLLSHDLDELRCWIFQHKVLPSMWLEEIWLDIIGKDCAVSVLHQCHVGILLERITGLNAENLFLHNGLSESNVLVTNLREQNLKVEKELQMCCVLKGRLLLDMSNSFDRITAKEQEASELSSRVNSFKKKIAGLQSLEETMLERSNYIGSELEVLKDELNANNENLRSAGHEKLFRENEMVNKRLEEMSLLLNEAYDINKTLRDELQIESNNKVEVADRLVMELINVNILLAEKNELLQDLQKDVDNVKQEKDYLESNVSTLNDNLHVTQVLVRENEIIAAEQLKKLFLENNELKSRLMVQDEVLEKYEELGKNLRKESDNKNAIVMERLEKEFLDASMLLGQKGYLVKELWRDIYKIAHEKDQFESEAYNSKEELKVAKIIAEKNEAISTEAKRKLMIELDLEYNERIKVIERFVIELVSINILLAQKSHLLEDSQVEIICIKNEKDTLESHMCILNEKLRVSQTLIEENGAIAVMAKYESTEMSKLLNEIQGKYEAVEKNNKASNNKNSIAIERLKKELLDASIKLGQGDHLVEELQKDISRIAHQRDVFKSEANNSIEELKVAKSIAEKNEAVLTEAQRNLLVENEQMKLQVEQISLLLNEVQVINNTLKNELDIEFNERVKITDRLWMELFEMNILLAQKNNILEDSQKTINCTENELKSHVSALNEKLQMSQTSNNKNTIAIEKLEKELLEANIFLGQMDHLVEVLQKDVSQVTYEKDRFESEAYTLKQEIKSARVIIEKNEVATEAQMRLKTEQALVQENYCTAVKHLENLLVENEELKLRLIEMSKFLDVVRQKYEVHEEALYNKSSIVIEKLEEEFLDASILLGQRDYTVKELQMDITRITHEKNQFESEAYILKEKLKEAKTKAKKIEVESTEIHKKLLLEYEQLKLQVEQLKRMLHEELQKEMVEITHVKELQSQMATLKEQLDMAESLAEENEAVATESRQIAEERKAYAQIKEEEVMLLERSVEELECTINALQEQVRIVKEEAEMQVRNLSDSWNVSGHLKEKITELEDAQHSIQILQKVVAEKELEILQCKSIISELNMHADAQARDYKRKFKELEDMAFQVKSEVVTSCATSLIASKSDKGSGKSRGSGSPFKCIGLGISQQINTEKDEELTSAKNKIEELEALAASRQKQIFMLNIRLASAESMTHDVLRDLLGIKLDMTNYAQEMNQRYCNGSVVMDKDKEWEKLRKQVEEFVEERQSLLEEINQRQKELLAAQIKSEKLHEQRKLLTTENELLKADNARYKNIVIELEEQMNWKKPSSQHKLTMLK